MKALRVTRILLGISIFAILCVATDFVLAADLSRPRFHHADPLEGKKNWRQYFDQVQSLDRAERSIEIQWFLEKTKFYGTPENYRPLILELQSVRTEMPLEFRWILAAREIRYEAIVPPTLGDAESALVNISVFKAPGFFSNDAVKLLAYRLPNEGKGAIARYLEFDSLTSAIRLETQWLSLVSQDRNFCRQTDFEAKRVEWMEAIGSLAWRIEVGDMRNLLEVFGTPTLREFSKTKDQTEFFDWALKILSATTQSHGRYVYNKSESTFVVSPPYVKDVATTRDIVLSWINGDIEYLATHFAELVRDELVTPESLFLRPPSENERSTLAKMLKSEKLSAEATLLVSLLWINNYSGFGSETDEVAADNLISLVFKAKTHGGGLAISLRGASTSRMSKEAFQFYVSSFYRILREKPILGLERAKKVLTESTPRAPGANDTDLEWLGLEWMRLQCVQANMPNGDFTSALASIVIGNGKSSLRERVLAAKYLRLEVKVPNLSDIANRTKAYVLAHPTKKASDPELQAWEQNDGELVHVVTALYPDQPDLKKYLTSVYLENRVDGPFSAQGALSLMGKVGNGSLEVRDEIIRRLHHIGPGDSARNFTMLITLFPNEGWRIAEILYLYRQIPDKLVPMLGRLVNAANENPQILNSLALELSNKTDSKVALALYQGLTLDAWLKSKMKKDIVCDGVMNSLGTGVKNEG